MAPDQGKRYSPGYPAWPELDDQKKLWKLLDPERTIGVSLTERRPDGAGAVHLARSCCTTPRRSTTRCGGSRRPTAQLGRIAAQASSSPSSSRFSSTLPSRSRAGLRRPEERAPQEGQQEGRVAGADQALRLPGPDDPLQRTRDQALALGHALRGEVRGVVVHLQEHERSAVQDRGPCHAHPDLPQRLPRRQVDREPIPEQRRELPLRPNVERVDQGLLALEVAVHGGGAHPRPPRQLRDRGPMKAALAHDLECRVQERLARIRPSRHANEYSHKSTSFQSLCASHQESSITPQGGS